MLDSTEPYTSASANKRNRKTFTKGERTHTFSLIEIELYEQKNNEEKKVSKNEEKKLPSPHICHFFLAEI